MNQLRVLRTQLVQDYFPHIADLREYHQLSFFSNHHLLIKPLVDILPFRKHFNRVQFYQYVDYQLPEVATLSRRNLFYWALTGARQFGNSPAMEITLFFDEVFFWHYYITAKEIEILQTLSEGHSCRFLSQFYLLQTKVKLEFNKIQIQPEESGPLDLVYTHS